MYFFLTDNTIQSKADRYSNQQRALLKNLKLTGTLNFCSTQEMCKAAEESLED